MTGYSFILRRSTNCLRCGPIALDEIRSVTMNVNDDYEMRKKRSVVTHFYKMNTQWRGLQFGTGRPHCKFSGELN